MLSDSPDKSPQSSLFNIVDQLDQSHPLIALGNAFDWSELDREFAPLYSSQGRKAKPIRLMCGLLMLKQMYNLSDESVVEQWRMNPYYQVFCGEQEFQASAPCHSTELVKFRQRLGESGTEKLFALSVLLHGDAAEEPVVLVDTTVQEKAITYPTDTKLAIRIINYLNKIAKFYGTKQRRTFVKEVRLLRIQSRHFRSTKRSGKARRALSRLRTIAGILLRELERKLPEEALSARSESFSLYRKVLSQSKDDKNKVYSLHEPDIYCMAKGKAHKPYEYGRKASVVSTLESQVIVGVKSHDEHVHDSKTLAPALEVANRVRTTAIETAVVDKGYRGSKRSVDAEVVLPSAPLKRDSQEQRERKRRLCQQRSAIEPIIGHLKHDYRLNRNWLKGSEGDSINLLMAACAWNLRKWMAIFFCFEKDGCVVGLMVKINAGGDISLCWIPPS